MRKAEVQTLKSEFESLQMKDTKSIEDFYMQLSALVTNIRTLGEGIEEAYVVKKLLRNVPLKFLQITSAIEQFGNLETIKIEETVGSLKAHEERVKGHMENNGGQLLLTKEEWKKRDNSEGNLLLTREEWLKRSGKCGTENFRNQSGGSSFNRGGGRGIRGNRS